MTGKARRRLSDEDWKTQLARGYPDVPAGAEVEIVEEGMLNFYGGPWSRIRYGGNLYWVDPSGVEKETGNGQA